MSEGWVINASKLELVNQVHFVYKCTKNVSKNKWPSILAKADLN